MAANMGKRRIRRALGYQGQLAGADSRSADGNGVANDSTSNRWGDSCARHRRRLWSVGNGGLAGASECRGGLSGRFRSYAQGRKRAKLTSNEAHELYSRIA